MKTTPKNDKDVATYISNLARLSPKDEEKSVLEKQLRVTIDYVSKLSEVNTDGVELTAQVTGLTNVFREDEIDESRVFSQEEALKNAKRNHNGFFVVDAILEEK